MTIRISIVDAEMITQIVQMKILAAYGVEPQLKHCVICGKEKGVFDYSIKMGELFVVIILVQLLAECI